MEAERMQRLEALLAIDERIASLEAAKGDKKPWWRNSALLAAYAGLIAFIPASVTAVAGWFENRGELQLAISKQEHERTLAYVGLAVDPSSNEAARLQVLRFLSSLDGDPIGAWAREELALVQTKIASLVDEKQEVIAEVEAADAKAKVAMAQAAELEVQAQADPRVAKAAAAKATEAEHLVAEVRRKRDRVDAISTRIGDAPLQIIELREGNRRQESTSVTPEQPQTPQLQLSPRRLK